MLLVSQLLNTFEFKIALLYDSSNTNIDKMPFRIKEISTVRVLNECSTFFFSFL